MNDDIYISVCDAKFICVDLRNDSFPRFKSTKYKGVSDDTWENKYVMQSLYM